MKKTLIYLVLTLVVFTPVIVLGADNLLQGIATKSGYDVKGTTETTISSQVGIVISAVLSLVGTIFLALTIYAGILWMTASGNDEQVSKSIEILKTSIIGLVIVMSSYLITNFIISNTESNMGACTYSNGACVLTTKQQCISKGGTFSLDVECPK